MCSSESHLTMRPHEGEGAFDIHYKKWSPEFFKERRFNEQTSYIKAIQNHFSDGENLNRFLEEYEGAVPSCMSEEVKEFYEQSFQASVHAQSTAATPKKAKIWLNDRQFSTQRSRNYEYRLTADQLHVLLLCKRFGLRCVPDADRRLIYIPDLDHNDIHALTETASYHQRDTLRNALWQHIAFQTSIRVVIPPMGFPIFRLEFHVPYSALRKQTRPCENHPMPANSRKMRRTWENLNFLRIPQQNQGHGVFGIHDAHVSVVICGSDHIRWVCYAFIDTLSKSPSPGNDDDGDEDEQDLDETNEDPIASDCEGYEINADTPICDPREYFLRTVDFRMRQILQEWTYLVRKIEISVERYFEEHPIILSRRAARDRLEELNKEFDWIIHTTKLLRCLQRRLSETIRAWEVFRAFDGDICYFTDLLSNLHLTRSLEGIRQSFERLKEIKHTLSYVNKSCSENSIKILDLRTSLASNRFDLDNHQLSHQLSYKAMDLNKEVYDVSFKTGQVALANHQTSQLSLLMNLFIASVAIPVAFFGMQNEQMPFIKNSKSLVVWILGTAIIMHLFAHIIQVALQNSWWQQVLDLLKSVMSSRNIDDNSEAYQLPLHEQQTSQRDNPSFP